MSLGHDLAVRSATALSYMEFYSQYLCAKQPLRLQGAMQASSAMRWSPEYFLEHFAHKHFVRNNQAVNLGAFIRRHILQNVTPDSAEWEQAGESAYLTNLNIGAVFPEIIAELDGVPAYASGNWRESSLISRLMGYGETTTQFFIGAASSAFPFLHIDYPPMHTFSALFYGRKEWIVIAPEYTDHLYVESRPSWPFCSQIDNIFDVDLTRYPDFAKVKAFRVVQEPGDLMFVPSGWWHSARSLTPTITVAWDHLSASCWDISAQWRLANMGQKGQRLKPLIAQAFKALGGLYGQRERRAAAAVDLSKPISMTI